MTRRTVLLIAYHFPPDDAIGGARPFRFYKYLKRLGYECHVITAARQEPGAPPDVEFVPDPLKTHPLQGLAWQAERVGWKFLLRAELDLGWSEAARRAGRSFLNNTKADSVTIVSSAPPVGTHLAAWRLSRYSGRPWIADFRDPIHSPSAEMAMLQTFVGPPLERSILKSSSLVLANTDSMRDVWAARYPEIADKIHVLWNGFDPEDEIHPQPLPERECKVLSHVGELYGGRDIRPIVHSLERLMENGRIPGGAIRVLQVGAADPADLPDESFRKRAQFEGWFEMREPVPAAVARKIAIESDGLLLIQPHTAVQVPGKLFEYLRMGRPIFAYVVPGSPVERILERAGVPYNCIYPGQSTAEIDRQFLEFCGKLGAEPMAPAPWFEETFEASRQTAALDQLISSVQD
jgi:Glycosyltransferase Family 4